MHHQSRCRAAPLAVTGILIGMIGVGALTGCTSQAASRSGATQSGSAAATITGTLLEYGGPMPANGTPPPPRPIAAIAAVYRRSPDGTAISGKPVAQTRTSPDGDGSFSLTVAPGEYVIVAESPDGSPWATPKPITAASGRTRSVDLQVDVP